MSPQHFLQIFKQFLNHNEYTAMSYFKSAVIKRGIEKLQITSRAKLLLVKQVL